MSVCPECGESVQAGWKVCPTCAVELPTQESQEIIMAAETIHHGDKISKKVVNDPAAIIAAYEKGKKNLTARLDSGDDLASLVERAKIVAGATGRDEKDVLADLMDDGIVNLSNKEEGGFEDLYNLGTLSEREERFSRFIDSVPGRIDEIRKKDETEILDRINKNLKRKRQNHSFSFIFFSVIPILAVLQVAGVIDLPLTGIWEKWCLYCCGMGCVLMALVQADEAPLVSMHTLGIYDHHRQEVCSDFEPARYSIGMVIPAYYITTAHAYHRRDSVDGKIIDYNEEDDILLMKLLDGSTYELVGEFFVKRLFQTGRKISSYGDDETDVITEYFGRKIIIYDKKFNVAPELDWL
jgi:hypothetical protein